jgi:hypothetical protein
MSKLIFEHVGDIRAAPPYYCVYTSDQMTEYRRYPFLEIAVEKEGNLVITIEARGDALRLTPEQWEEVLIRARAYHKEMLDKNEE